MRDKKIHFGWYLRMRRDEVGLTQRGLGDRVGLSDRRMSQLEHMEKPVTHRDTLRRIAEALGMTLPELDRQWQSTFVSKPPPSNREKGSNNGIGLIDVNKLLPERGSQGFVKLLGGGGTRKRQGKPVPRPKGGPSSARGKRR